MSNITARNNSLDAARGILMILGVFLHAAAIYSPDGDWLIADSSRSEVFAVLSDLIHVFRMPTFFWISGYFCALTFERNGIDGLLRNRLPRIFIPLLTSWATLNVIQEMFLASIHGKSLTQGILDGVPLYHLWFLFDLLIFIGIAAIIFRKPRLFERFGNWLEKQSVLTIFPILAGCSFVASAVARSTGISYDMLVNLTNIARLAAYGPFFAIGIFMFRSSKASTTFMRIPPFCLFLTLPLALLAHKYSYGHGSVMNELALFAQLLMTWFSVAGILALFHKFMKNSNHLTRLFSDAAYTIYLFHHLIVVITGAALLGFDIDIWLKFIIVCATSLTCSVLIHVMLIRPNRIARLLINGKLPAANDTSFVRVERNQT